MRARRLNRGVGVAALGVEGLVRCFSLRSWGLGIRVCFLARLRVEVSWAPHIVKNDMHEPPSLRHRPRALTDLDLSSYVCMSVCIYIYIYVFFCLRGGRVWGLWVGYSIWIYTPRYRSPYSAELPSSRPRTSGPKPKQNFKSVTFQTCELC